MSIKATRRAMISCYAQIIHDYVLGYKIPELVKHEKIKARKLSYDSQVYLLMLGQFLHVFCLNELVDISKIYAKELSRIRGISPANLNTFSNANRTRNPSVMEKFFMVANVASRLPHFCVYGKANEHDSKKEEMLFESLKAGDIGILDRAYNNFETLYRQSHRRCRVG